MLYGAIYNVYINHMRQSMIEISKRCREGDKKVNLAETNYSANIGNKYRPVTIVVINCVINA